MPGGRLTARDRSDIALGLTEGIGYAEIARRLRRPTSTVSREVNRNGGCNQYRADQAHRAAEARAGRSRLGGSSPADAEPVAGADGVATGEGDSAVVRGVEHKLIEMMTAAGFPRMMAVVLVGLFTSDSGTLTVNELVERSHVSPASISKAVRSLEHLGFVTRKRDLAGRRERYLLDEGMWTAVWTARSEAMAHWAVVVTEAAEALGPATPAGGRLEQWGRFITFLHTEMVQATERWARLVT